MTKVKLTNDIGDALEAIKQFEISPNKVNFISSYQDPSLSLEFFADKISLEKNTCFEDIRSIIESSIIELSEEILGEYKKFTSSIADVQENVDQMMTKCDDIAHKMSKIKNETDKLAKRTSELKERRDSALQKKNFLTIIMKSVKLTDEEVNLIQNPEQITQEYIDLHHKLTRVFNNQKLLLKANILTKSDSLTSITLLRETSFEKIYWWSQNELRKMTSEVPVIPKDVIKALGILHEREHLLKYTLREYASVRQAFVIHYFLSIMSSDELNNKKNTDSIKYLSDILAWTYQNVVSERDYIFRLLEGVPFPTDIKRDTTIVEVTIDIFKHLNRTFKLRVDQLFAGNHDVVTLFQLHNLLKFYQNKIGNLVHPHGNTDNTITEFIGIDEEFNLSWSIITNSLQKNRNFISSDVHWSVFDLTVNDVVKSNMKIFASLYALPRIMSSEDNDSSLTSNFDEYFIFFEQIFYPMIEKVMDESRKKDYNPDVDEVARVEFAYSSKYSYEITLNPSSLVYLINNLDYINDNFQKLLKTNSTLQTRNHGNSFNEAIALLKQLRDMIIGKYVELQFKCILDQINFASSDKDSVNFLKNLNDFLFNLEIYDFDTARKFHSKKLRKSLKILVCEKFIEFYSTFYRENSEKTNYSDNLMNINHVTKVIREYCNRLQM